VYSHAFDPGARNYYVDGIRLLRGRIRKKSSESRQKREGRTNLMRTALCLYENGSLKSLISMSIVLSLKYRDDHWLWSNVILFGIIRPQI
jgi:hypothetical protein